MARKQPKKAKIADLPLNRKITARNLENIRGGADKKPGKKTLF